MQIQYSPTFSKRGYNENIYLDMPLILSNVVSTHKNCFSVIILLSIHNTLESYGRGNTIWGVGGRANRVFFLILTVWTLGTDKKIRDVYGK